MWTLDVEGRGRRSTVKGVSNGDLKVGLADLVQCDDFIGAILGFKGGESEATHQVQLLRFERRESELLATSFIRWYDLDVMEKRLEKANFTFGRAIWYHRLPKEKIETLSEKPELDTVEDLLDLSKAVALIFARPATPRKTLSPRKRASPEKSSSPQKRKPGTQTLSFDKPLTSTGEVSDGSSESELEAGPEDDDEDEDEEEEMVPSRKRKQTKARNLQSKLAAASLDSPQKSKASASIPSSDLGTSSFIVEDFKRQDGEIRERTRDNEDQEDDEDDDEKLHENMDLDDAKLKANTMGTIKKIPLAEGELPSSTLVDEAVAELHPASDPPAHLCRDSQFDQLFIALESAISAQTGSCIYVSGTPGTGKTSVIREVIGQLDLRVRENELTPFTFLEINGMKLVQPNAAYEHLWEVLGRGQMAVSNVMTALESAFSTDEPIEKRGVIVLLLDEMDQLVTKGQQLMYNFFNWPSLPHSRLVVIAVANTMDLPERILSNKISSRVGLTRIQFPGYTHTELKEIVSQRLYPKFSSLIEDDAVEYATRKVAGVGGDARKVLDIVRQTIVTAAAADAATTPAAAGSQLPVKTAQVRDVIVDSQQVPAAVFIRSLGVATKVLLCAILARIRRTNNIETPLHDVLKQASQFVRSSGQSEKLAQYLYPGNTARLAFFQPAVMELVESGLLVQQAIKGEATPRVRLMVPVATVKDQLEFDSAVKGMI